MPELPSKKKTKENSYFLPWPIIVASFAIFVFIINFSPSIGFVHIGLFKEIDEFIIFSFCAFSLVYLYFSYRDITNFQIFFDKNHRNRAELYQGDTRSCDFSNAFNAKNCVEIFEDEAGILAPRLGFSNLERKAIRDLIITALFYDKNRKLSLKILFLAGTENFPGKKIIKDYIKSSNFPFHFDSNRNISESVRVVLEKSWKDYKRLSRAGYNIPQDYEENQFLLKRANKLASHFSFKIKEHKSSGLPSCLIKTNNNRYIYINNNFDDLSKSFSICHEIAHDRLSHKSALWNGFRENNKNKITYSIQEIQSNIYSAIMLYLFHMEYHNIENDSRDFLNNKFIGCEYLM